MANVDTGTVGKALGVLDLVATQDRPVRFAELQRLSPLPKATLYRFLQTLVVERLVVRDAETGAYSLGMRLVRLAHAAWNQASLAPIARPHLNALAAATGRAIQLAQLEYGHVLYVDKLDWNRAGAAFADAARIAPAYCTSEGKAMLAYLDPMQLDLVLDMQGFERLTPGTLTSKEVLKQALARVRARGYAVDEEEYEAGMISIASPILSAENHLLGAVSVSGSREQTNLNELETCVPELRDCAETIAVDMMQWSFPIT